MNIITKYAVCIALLPTACWGMKKDIFTSIMIAREDEQKRSNVVTEYDIEKIQNCCTYRFLLKDLPCASIDDVRVNSRDTSISFVLVSGTDCKDSAKNPAFIIDRRTKKIRRVDNIEKAHNEYTMRIPGKSQVNDKDAKHNVAINTSEQFAEFNEKLGAWSMQHPMCSWSHVIARTEDAIAVKPKKDIIRKWCTKEHAALYALLMDRVQNNEKITLTREQKKLLRQLPEDLRAGDHIPRTSSCVTM